MNDFGKCDVFDFSDNTGQRSETALNCKTIYVGKHHFNTTEQVRFNTKEIRAVVPHASKSELMKRLSIKTGEVVNVVAHFSSTPLQNSVISINVARGCAQHICQILGIEEAKDSNCNIVFSTKGPAEMRKVIFECESPLHSEAFDALRNIFYFVNEINAFDAQQLLERYKNDENRLEVFRQTNYDSGAFSDATTQDTMLLSPKKQSVPNNKCGQKVLESVDIINDVVITNTVSDSSGDEIESAMQLIVSPNDIRQLMIYPTGKGGISINTQDYKCLAPDQFLNDVIIDFYLKWLQNNLVETQVVCDKTFIFSTFFYNRLTAAKQDLNSKIGNDIKQTTAQKRHAQVAKWTKNVNLFEKDFIIVPINERSHWFLAIICFPYLTGPVTYDTLEPVSPQGINHEKHKKRQFLKSNIDLSPPKKSVSMSGNCSSVASLAASFSAIGEINDCGNECSNTEHDNKDLDASKEIRCLNNDCVAANGALTACSDSSAIAEQISTEHANKNVRNRIKIRPIKQPLILIFDSLDTSPRTHVVSTLRDYLACEYQQKMSKNEPRAFSTLTMPGHCVNVPQQSNHTDCGVFLLQYVEQFFKDPIRDYSIPIKQLEYWFDGIIVIRKRKEIAQLLKKLIDKQHQSCGGQEEIVLPHISFPKL